MPTDRSRLLAPASLIAALSLLFALVANVPPAEAQDGVATHTDTLQDGTSWRADIPTDWNGTVFTDLDHAGFFPGAPIAEWKRVLLEEGYAFIGTERNTAGYAYGQAIDNQVEGLGLFEDLVGEAAEEVVAYGSSRGAFVARGAVERYPEVFSGAVAVCGGGGGVVQTFNQKLDAVFALQVLFADDPELDLSAMQLVDIEDTALQNALINEIVAHALTTDEGRARLSLAAAFSQVQPWSATGTERPAPRDWDAQLDNIAAVFAFGHPAQVRQGIEEAAGGNVSWNHDVDYRQQLNRSGAKQRVDALYRASSADLNADLARLASAPRIAADPQAVSFAEQNITYTGEVEAPVLTMHTIGDPVDPPPLDTAYAQTFRRAGNNALLQRVYVDKPGHCNFTTAETLTAVTTLLDRIESGRWANSATPRALNQRAEGYDEYGSAAFVHVPDQQPLRTWDVDDWGAYEAP